jgi:hypothetical protein
MIKMMLNLFLFHKKRFEISNLYKGAVIRFVPLRFYINNSIITNSCIASVLQQRHYSSDNPKYIPLKIYPNADTDKLSILVENKDKSGVYLWRNLINNKVYIGSSINLSRRFKEYYSIYRLLNIDPEMLISKGLLKYGYSNFSLEIIEYCELSNLIEREQYYIDLLKPEYNIEKVAGRPPKLDFTEELRAKISASIKEKWQDKNYYALLSSSIPTSQKILVIDLTSETEVSFFSIREAGKVLGIDRRSIAKYLDDLSPDKKPILGRYII